MEEPDPSFQEYETISKTKFLDFRGKYYDEIDWNEICRYSTLLKDWAKKGDVEEEPGPKGDNLYFGGFIGNYRLNSGKEFEIVLNERKLNIEEYDVIINEVSDWSYLLGPHFYTHFTFSQPLHEFENILSYSNHLIDLSDLALSSFLSPVIEQVTKVSPTVHGRINIQKTTRNLIQSQMLIVSKKTRLMSDTLPILLLVRFNYEVSRGIQVFLKGLERKAANNRNVRTSFETTLLNNISFHHSTLLNPRIRELTQRSLETDFHNPEVLQKTIKQSNGNSIYQDLVLLWEGYSAKRPLRVRPEAHFRGGYSLKPVSKLYELWVLNQINNILGDYYRGISYSQTETGITFTHTDGPSQIKLHYSCSISDFTKFNRPPSPMYPDFLISKTNGEENSVLALDAKYKPVVNAQDVQQLIAYMLVTGWADPTDTMYGALIYVGDRNRNNSIQNYTRKRPPSADISKICLRPGYAEGYNDLKQLLTKALDLK